MPRARYVAVLITDALLVLAGCAAARPATRSAADEAGFATIFDGTNMDGWETIIEPGHPFKSDAFYLEDGALACKGYGYHWFRYKEPLGDCIVRLEFKVAKGTNSGVVLRSKEQPPPPPFTGFEVQIVDDVGQAPDKHTTGAIYDMVAPTRNASKPIGEWNEMEITCDGLRVRVVLNGQEVINTDFATFTRPIGKFDFAYADLPRQGYLALQDHWTPIWYRNIRLKRLR